MNSVCVDTAPPVISVLTPYADQRFSEGVSVVPIQVATDEVATCKWSYVDTTYGSMNVNFVTTTGLTHISQEYNPVPNWYTLYVRCQDAKGNVATASTTITFVVDPQSGGGQV